MNNVEIIQKNEEERLKRLEELGLREEDIEKCKKFIKNVDQEKADELGEELVTKISSSKYDEEGKGYDEVLKLIRDGANLEFVSDKDNFAIYLCARKGYLKTFITLLKSGANINQTNRKKTTTIMSAARHGHLEILDIAILMGGDVNARCFDGDTALMMAKRHGFQDCFERLIKANANIATKNFINQNCRAILHMDGPVEVDDSIYYAEDEYFPYRQIVEETLSDAVNDAKRRLHQLQLSRSSKNK